MANFDWVPWNAFGTELALLAGDAQQDPALEVAQFLSPAVEGQIEPYDSYFVHRIVGQVFVSAAAGTTPDQPVQWVIWPGIVDSFAGLVQTPIGAGGSVGAAIFDAAVANAEIWAVRTYFPPVASTGAGPQFSIFAHPWYAQVDIKPKRRLDVNEVPVLTIFNPSATTALFYVQYLRMLVSRG